MTAHRPRHALNLSCASAQLKGGIPVGLLGPLRDNLAIVDLEDGHRNVAAVIREDTGHADFAGYKAGAHRSP
jgi:hypothetical protein